MFDKLATYIEDTPLTTLNRKYYNGEDNINMIPLVDVLEPEEVTALNDVFDMSFKTEVEELRSQCHIDMNNPAYESLLKLIDVVEKKFDCERSDHLDARIWHDKEGFYFWPHVDNTNIHISIQIYLDNNAPEWCGTSFFYNGLERGDNFVNMITPPYKVGSGYLLLNTNTEVHGMINKVPPGCSRTSLYSVSYTHLTLPTKA